MQRIVTHHMERSIEQLWVYAIVRWPITCLIITLTWLMLFIIRKKLYRSHRWLIFLCCLNIFWRSKVIVEWFSHLFVWCIEPMTLKTCINFSSKKLFRKWQLWPHRIEWLYVNVCLILLFFFFPRQSLNNTQLRFVLT